MQRNLTHVIQRKCFKKQRLGPPRGHLYYCSSSWWSKLSIMVTWRQGCWWIQFSLTFLRRNIASSFKSHKPRLTQFGWWGADTGESTIQPCFSDSFIHLTGHGTLVTSHAFLATVECRGTRFGRAVSASFHIWDHPPSAQIGEYTKSRGMVGSIGIHTIVPLLVESSFSL